MRKQLWPDCPEDDHHSEMEMLINCADQNPVMVACEGEKLIGFLEASPGFHNLIPICAPVFYIEGLFVEGIYRRSGVARKLVHFAEELAKRNGLHEIYSDTDLWNETSASANRRIGFKEINRTMAEVIFKKA